MALYGGPIVDAHHHLWNYAPATHPWLAATDGGALARDFAAADYLVAADSLNVVATVWIEALATDALAEAKWAASVHSLERRLGNAIIAHAPLDAPDIAERLDRMQSALPTLRGIRDIVAVRPGAPTFARGRDLMVRPAFEAGLRELASRHLVFDLMLEPWQMPAALALARRIPGLLFVIEHAGSPDFSSESGTGLWKDVMQAAAKLPNMAVKISALHCRMPGWTDIRLATPILSLIEWFGVHRLAFGSDYPVHDRTVPFDRSYETFARTVAGLSRSEQAALFHDTARRLYRI